MTVPAICAHELIHSLTRENHLRVDNPYLAVSAVEDYIAFLGIPRASKYLKQMEEILDRPPENASEEKIEEMRQRAQQRIEKGDNKYAVVEAVFREYGHALGIKAVRIETETGQMGAGLFFLREVLQGKGWREAETAIKKKLPRELREWQKKHGKHWFGIHHRRAVGLKIAGSVQLGKLRRMKKD